MLLDRRTFALGLLGISTSALGGCSSTLFSAPVEPVRPKTDLAPGYKAVYAAIPNERFAIPAADLEKVPQQYYRRQVPYATSENVGTIVVDTQNFFLYLVQEDGMAMRYGVGLGRAGFEWAGRARVGWKQEWPKWTPPDEMIERQPELEKWSWRNGGMPPGLDNPLGARALYIFQGNTDTLYRIHGSPEYWTIGKSVSSGCVRMMNHDIIDLYNRVPKNTPIVVLGSGAIRV